MTIKRFIAIVALTAASALAMAAVPTVDTVQAEVQRGNYAQAEVMMQDVVAAKPGSARAHYIYAEILAHNKRFDRAAQEAAQARRIDPAIGFTDAAKFTSLEQLLAREQAAAAAPRTQPSSRVAPVSPSAVGPATAYPAERSGGMPGWIWGVGLVAVALIAWKMFNRRPAAGAGMASMAAPGAMAAGGQPGMGNPGMAGYGGGGGFGQGMAPGGYPYAQQRPGSGMMGVGLAAAGGVAAGMLAEKMLHENHGGVGGNAAAAGAGGGFVPGMFDDASGDNAAARELEQRPVDFGNGDGWGGGDDGSAGLSDSSSSGGGDDGGW